MTTSELCLYSKGEETIHVVYIEKVVISSVDMNIAEDGQQQK